VGLARARSLARRASAMPRGFSEIAARAEQQIGASADVRVSDAIDGPMVTGVLAPVVLMPRAALAWDEARWRAVLLHELAHVKQRDCLAQIVAQIVCAANWFDPLVWWGARRLRLERELAADERVLASGARPVAYAEHLVA